MDELPASDFIIEALPVRPPRVWSAFVGYVVAGVVIPGLAVGSLGVVIGLYSGIMSHGGVKTDWQAFSREPRVMLVMIATSTFSLLAGAGLLSALSPIGVRERIAWFGAPL